MRLIVRSVREPSNYSFINNLILKNFLHMKKLLKACYFCRQGKCNCCHWGGDVANLKFHTGTVHAFTVFIRDIKIQFHQQSTTNNLVLINFHYTQLQNSLAERLFSKHVWEQSTYCSTEHYTRVPSPARNRNSTSYATCYSSDEFSRIVFIGVYVRRNNWKPVISWATLYNW